MPSHQLNSKTNDLALLLKTILKLFPVAMDGNGFKFEKTGKFFQVFDATSSKNPQEIYYG